MDLLNPLRKTDYKSYKLVHRNDGKTAHIKLHDVWNCKILFNHLDVVIVRTTGIREYTDTKGKQCKKSGNIYIHYMQKCIEEYDSFFSFKKIVVLKETLKHLPADALAKFRKQGLKTEK